MIAGETYERYLGDLVAGRRGACLSTVQSLLKQGTPLRGRSAIIACCADEVGAFDSLTEFESWLRSQTRH